MRRTLEAAVEVTGTGLHGGQPVRLTMTPTDAGTGVRFIRTDLDEGRVVPARYDLVSDTQLCTRLTNEAGTSVGTVEHVMAALAGTGVTDCDLLLDGPEVPIADGSSEPFVEAILLAGVRELKAPVRAIRILEPVRYEDGDKWAELTPADHFQMDFRIEFQDPAIGTQSHRMDLTGDSFVTELAQCRTFGHLHEVQYMRSIGLALGGSLKNAIVVDRGRVLNPEGLRHEHEFVRHKMLDAVGDLALAEAPIIGRYSGFKAGHGLTNELLRALFDNPRAWCYEDLAPGLTPGGAIAAPADEDTACQALAV